MTDWIRVDPAFAAQMALRDDLIATRPAEVHALLPAAKVAAQELFDTVVGLLPSTSYFRDGDGLVRPDGVRVVADRAHPLLSLGRLVQADFCLMLSGPRGHWLGGAILCFPSRWRLADKIGRALPEIHAPVPEYDDGIARRVQRLFDGVRAGHPLMRWNYLPQERPELFQTGRKSEPASTDGPTRRFLRMERQGIVRLPRSGAVAFSIHTYQVRRADQAIVAT